MTTEVSSASLDNLGIDPVPFITSLSSCLKAGESLREALMGVPVESLKDAIDGLQALSIIADALLGLSVTNNGFVQKSIMSLISEVIRERNICPSCISATMKTVEPNDDPLDIEILRCEGCGYEIIPPLAGVISGR